MQQQISFIILNQDYALEGAHGIKTGHFDMSDPHNLINYTATQQKGKSLKTDAGAPKIPWIQPEKGD